MNCLFVPNLKNALRIGGIVVNAAHDEFLLNNWVVQEARFLVRGIVLD